MKTEYWHKEFTWDGHSFQSEQEIIDFVEQRFPELVDFIFEWFSEKGEVTMRTSGSTGAPKRIVLQREHMVHSARATGAFFDLDEHSRVLHCLPLGYIAGRMMLVRAMILGWKLEMVPVTSNPDISLSIVYDFAAMVPLQLYNSMDRLDNIKTLIVGGGAVSNEMLRAISGLKTKIYATYGMTETVTHVAICPVNRAAGKTGQQLEYRALPGIRFSTDQRQCLVIEAPSISNEKVVTNDIVELHSESSFTWLSRFDHVINSGGIKLIPELVEAKLKHIINESFFMWGIPDKTLGQKLVLLIEGDRPYEVLNLLRSYQKLNPDRISKFEIPKEVYFVKSFSRTETGKIQRSQTVALLMDLDA